MNGEAMGRGRSFGLAVLFCVAFVGEILAHPGVGIVRDSRGNVFYTDLKRVWKIAPGGRKTVAVGNVHTHELCLDARDNLYGEHLWYEGEKTDKWGHRVWRRTPDGTVTAVIPAREGFRTDYSFVRDVSGAMYWAERRNPTLIRRRLPGGAVSTVAECRDCRDVGWMTAAADGTVYFTDSGDLREVSPAGVLRTVARGLARRSWTQPHVSPRHALMGLWTDAARNVYVAGYGTREVKRIAANGGVEVVAVSGFPWSPTGGMVAGNGDLWILECSLTNAVRVRRVARGGRVTIY